MLALSPVPMVRGFGLLLVAGIAVALACALTLGIAALSAARRSGGAPAAPGARPPPSAAPATSSARRSAARATSSPATASRARRAAVRPAPAAARCARRRPTPAASSASRSSSPRSAGASTRAPTSSPTSRSSSRRRRAADLEALQKATGVGGEIDVVVASDKLTDPAVVRWMTRYQDGLLKRFGYSEKRGCGKAELCPAFSLPDLFRSGGASSQQQISALLDAVPPYFSQGVITRDRRTATLAFGIRLMPLERQEQVISSMRRQLHPPAGVHAQLAGLPVLAAEANDKVASPWRRVLGARRRPRRRRARAPARLPQARRALVPLVPIALATGWSALVLFCLRIPLNPMSVTLGALVIAISTEFSVLLSERFRAERAAGHAPPAALERTYRSTGAAVLASGTTAIAGFAVLVVSDIRMLRDFGFVTVIDLTVALARRDARPARGAPAGRARSAAAGRAAPRRPRLRRPRAAARPPPG